MQGMAILHGDILVVDRGITPAHGHVVVASYQGDFILRQLMTHPQPMLVAYHPDYHPIYFSNAEPIEIFGVASSIVRKLA